jgi:thiamine kinase-like enzyme
MVDEEARAALAAIPALAGYEGPLERLGGLTNLVFRAGDACLRIPGKGMQEYINRANEAVAAREAAMAGVSPELLHVDGETGVMVTRFIAGAETMSPEKFKTRPGSPARAGKAFRRLHTSGAVFPFRFELFAMIDDYLKVLSTKDVALPAGYHDVVIEAETVRSALAAHPLPLVACHCDPLCENFLDTGDRMWIVDWEYSGMNDPTWDLAYVSVEAGFDAGQDGALLAAYFGRPAAKAEAARLHAFKALCQLLSALWALVQRSGGNRTADFLAHAEATFAEAGTRMRGAEFAKQLDLLRQG